MANKSKLQTDFYDSITAFSRALMPVRLDLLADLDINLTQEELLSTYDQPLHIKDIALLLAITSSAATQLVESLESGGYVTRKHSQQDRRVVDVLLTEKGRAKQQQILEARRKLIDMMTMNLTEAEIHKLLRIQTKIITGLKEA